MPEGDGSTVSEIRAAELSVLACRQLVKAEYSTLRQISKSPIYFEICLAFGELVII